MCGKTKRETIELCDLANHLLSKNTKCECKETNHLENERSVLVITPNSSSMENEHREELWKCSNF